MPSKFHSRRRFTVRSFVKGTKHVVVCDGQIYNRDLVLHYCTVRSIPTTRVVKKKKGGTADEPRSLRELALALGFKDVEIFGSKREATRYIKLLELVEQGKIRNLERQPKFDLHTTTPAGLKVTICSYYADFRYEDLMSAASVNTTPQVVIEDSKQMPTKEYEIKRKWVEAEHAISIREV